jgi:hypothetical protein
VKILKDKMALRAIGLTRRAQMKAEPEFKPEKCCNFEVGFAFCQKILDLIEGKQRCESEDQKGN